MKAIIERATGVVVFLWPDRDQVRLDHRGLLGPSVRAPSIRPETHELVEVPTPPEEDPSDAVSAYAWNGSQWTVIDQSAITARRQARRQARREADTVDLRQFKLALLDAGLYDQVATIITGLPAAQRKRLQIELEASREISRTAAWVEQLGTALGLDEAGLDALFEAAHAL